MAEMIPLAGDGGSEGGVRATETGSALDALRAQLAQATQGGAGDALRAAQKENHMVTVGGADPLPKEAEQPAADVAKQVPPLPEGGVDKFYNKETGEYNWQAHAREAEYRAKMAQGKAAKAAKAAPKVEQQAAEGEGQEVEKTARAAVQDAGLDWAELEEKINVMGEIEPDDYAALEKIGLPRNVVDAHIAGLKAMAEQTQAKLLGMTGGKEGLNALLDWANKNLNPAEIDAYNEMLRDQRWPVAIDALKARSGMFAAQQAEQKPQPQIIRPGGPSLQRGATGDVFESEEAFQKAMGSKEYKASERYRQEVYAKLQRTMAARRGAPSVPAWQQKFVL